MNYFLQQCYFVLRFRYKDKYFGSIRKIWYRLFGMKIGDATVLPKIFVTWPHQVQIGDNCTLEHGIFFKYDGIWKKGPSIIIDDNVYIGSGCEFNINTHIVIGKYTLIASGCRFVDHNHGIELGAIIRYQSPVCNEIIINEDVWLGCNVVVLKGVIINKGAVVASGAVVTKSIPANEIWAGVPAKKIGERHSITTFDYSKYLDKVEGLV